MLAGTAAFHSYEHSLSFYTKCEHVFKLRQEVDYPNVNVEYEKFCPRVFMQA